jgi:hypothetical protein
MFRVVLSVVPGLFCVKYLEAKNVLRFYVFARACVDARVRIRARMPNPIPARMDLEHVEHMEQPLFPITYNVLCLLEDVEHI